MIYTFKVGDRVKFKSNEQMYGVKCPSGFTKEMGDTLGGKESIILRIHQERGYQYIDISMGKKPYVAWNFDNSMFIPVPHHLSFMTLKEKRTISKR